MRHKSLLTGVAVAVVLSMSGMAVSFGANTSIEWKPPKDGVVRDSVTAISIARLIWFSMHPELKQSSEQAWQSGMVAYLDKGVWRVQQKPLKSDAIGGGLEIDISKRDGRIVAIYLTQ